MHYRVRAKSFPRMKVPYLKLYIIFTTWLEINKIDIIFRQVFLLSITIYRNSDFSYVSNVPNDFIIRPGFLSMILKLMETIGEMNVE